MARREKLIDEVWRTVVNDEVLSRAISQLRSHLGDDAKLPRYIQTVPKAGYRLIAEPLVIEAPSPGQALPQMSDSVGEGDPDRLSWLTRRNMAIIALVALLAVLLLPSRDDPYQDRIPGGHADLWDWFEAIIQGDSDPSQITSVAVLPFDDLSEEGDHAYLGDGITDELIIALSNAPGLQVVARRSILDLPEGIKDIRRIGQHFGVDMILEGTVKRYDDRLRITAQLGSTEDGFVRWSQTYDEPLGDIYSMQRKVAAVITGELHGNSEIEIEAPVPAQSAPSLEAYQLFLNGRYLMKLRGRAPLMESIRMFEQALSSDPEFFRARLALARATVVLPFYDDTVSEQAMYDRALSILDAITLSEARERGEADSIRGFVANRR